jgi:hypothetical protein
MNQARMDQRGRLLLQVYYYSSTIVVVLFLHKGKKCSNDGAHTAIGSV